MNREFMTYYQMGPTFMLLETEETENMDGTRTVNGPDVVRISWQPCSVDGEGWSQNSDGSPEAMGLDG
jgi:hypothetical protein